MELSGSYSSVSIVTSTFADKMIRIFVIFQEVIIP